ESQAKQAYVAKEMGKFFHGMLMFFLKDEKENPMLTWKYAESHAMWGMIALFASGLALGKLVIETGAIKELSLLIAALHLSPGLPVMAMACLFACFMSEISSNTASASISIPVVIGIDSSLSLNPIPYILGTIAAANCAYILPIPTRAIRPLRLRPDPIRYDTIPSYGDSYHTLMHRLHGFRASLQRTVNQKGL
ncbi:SLC13 family permease, partial [Dialister succinatiphilus]|uniref:SLC13 family permease n=1 Tax=Dialister succinatiphilus TaxID=487173 RepID=UPI0040280F72